MIKMVFNKRDFLERERDHFILNEVLYNFRF